MNTLSSWTTAGLVVSLAFGPACTDAIDLEETLPACGDGIVASREQCDDRNRDNFDGCTGVCLIEPGYACTSTAVGSPSLCAPVCGDGMLVPGQEACDDGNLEPGDGCSPSCEIEAGWVCFGSDPSDCTGECGDGQILGDEECDDGNAFSRDGCSGACTLEPGFTCSSTTTPTRCDFICGDGLIVEGEACDDANMASSDGCAFPGCQVEDGWTCTPRNVAPSMCFQCGNGMIDSGEACDDGGRGPGDGCSSSCQVELGWTCDMASPTACQTICGDGLALGREACDDGNADLEDGCDANCVVEEGWTCQTTTGTTSRCSSHWLTRDIPTAIDEAHEGVWTGTEAVVWGGGIKDVVVIASGQRYNLGTNTWSPLPVAGAPPGRLGHTAVWTGSEMIVFGGFDPVGVLNNGGRYDLTSDAWSPIDDPSPGNGRAEHTAVWTGSEMIVFGGFDGTGVRNDGLRYNPAQDSWSATAVSDVARQLHLAVWTGTEMIIFGGLTIVNFDAAAVNSPRAYNPATDSWRTLPDPPFAPRLNAKGVWTGTELVVFGGLDAEFRPQGGGARYNPAMNAWVPLPTLNAPTPRDEHSMVFGDGEVYVVGGGRDDTVGARWRLADDTWRPLTRVLAPNPSRGTAGWTGEALIVVADDLSGLYRPPPDN